jgi:hypothetical protein
MDRSGTIIAEEEQDYEEDYKDFKDFDDDFGECDEIDEEEWALEHDDGRRLNGNFVNTLLLYSFIFIYKVGNNFII